MDIKDRYVKALGILGIILSVMVVIGGFCFRNKIINDRIIGDPTFITSIIKYEKDKDRYPLSEYAPLVYDQSSFSGKNEITLQGDTKIRQVNLGSQIYYKVIQNNNEIFETPNSMYLNQKEINDGKDKVGFSTTRDGNTFIYILNYSDKESTLKLIGIGRDGSTNTGTIKGETVIVDFVEANRIKVRVKKGSSSINGVDGNGTYYFRLNKASIVEKDNGSE
ncbi:MAG: hypothetical protein RR840_01220 [Clostridium sp.]